MAHPNPAHPHLERERAAELDGEEGEQHDAKAHACGGHEQRRVRRHDLQRPLPRHPGELEQRGKQDHPQEARGREVHQPCARARPVRRGSACAGRWTTARARAGAVRSDRCTSGGTHMPACTQLASTVARSRARRDEVHGRAQAQAQARARRRGSRRRTLDWVEAQACEHDLRHNQPPSLRGLRDELDDHADERGVQLAVARHCRPRCDDADRRDQLARRLLHGRRGLGCGAPKVRSVTTEAGARAQGSS